MGATHVAVEGVGSRVAHVGVADHVVARSRECRVQRLVRKGVGAVRFAVSSDHRLPRRRAPVIARLRPHELSRVHAREGHCGGQAQRASVSRREKERSRAACEPNSSSQHASRAWGRGNRTAAHAGDLRDELCIEAHKLGGVGLPACFEYLRERLEVLRMAEEAEDILGDEHGIIHQDLIVVGQLAIRAHGTVGDRDLELRAHREVKGLEVAHIEALQGATTNDTAYEMVRQAQHGAMAHGSISRVFGHTLGRCISSSTTLFEVRRTGRGDEQGGTGLPPSSSTNPT